MKLTKEALGKINTLAVRRELSGLLKCTEQTIIRYIHKNEDNGPLTTMAAVALIGGMTGLSPENILETDTLRTLPDSIRKN